MKAITVTPHESHLKSDGTVFPPVTPDPPLPPGQEDIQVPDIMPVRTPDGPSTTASTTQGSTQNAPEGPAAEAAAAATDSVPEPSESSTEDAAPAGA